MVDVIWADRFGREKGYVGKVAGDFTIGTENTFALKVESSAGISQDCYLMIDGTEYGGMDTMPDIVGLGLWKQGHWGVYVGNGYAIEAMGTQYGVVRTKVEGRGWQGWCKIPYIQYDD